MTMARIVGGMRQPSLNASRSTLAWGRSLGSLGAGQMLNDIYALASQAVAGPVCISAPAAVVTILVSSTSERHPYREAEHMSLCCCLRNVDGLQVGVNVAWLLARSKQLQPFCGGPHARHNSLCKHADC